VFNGNLPSGTTSSTGHTTDTTSTKKSGTAVPATDAAGVPLGPDDPELANAISAIPQGQGAATVEAALAGDPQDQATPPPSNAQTWQMIAGQGQVSPLTLQLAQLAGYSANATATG
jgi:hypothetical protein